MKGYSFGELVKLAEAAVPKSRKINGKGLTADITLSAADVGLGSVDNTADAAKNVLSATKLTTARTIGGVTFDGTANINLPGVNAAGNQSTSGNAATATKLVTPRAINGTNFDGSVAITTASWGTARTLTIGNAGKSVNGSSNAAWSLDEIGAYHPGNILGDVGFSGNTPNGAVISRRNGSNGNVIKFADGTIIITKGVTWSGAVDQAWGALFESATIDLGFMESAAVAATVAVAVFPTSVGSIFHACVTPFDASTGKAPSIKLLRGTPVSGINVEISITVTGRWR